MNALNPQGKWGSLTTPTPLIEQITGTFARRHATSYYGWLDVAGMDWQVFFHEANLPGDTRKQRHRVFTKLVAGRTRLMFDLKETPKGFSAINLHVLPDGDHA